MTKASDKYYLLPDEHELYRACKLKKYITKVILNCVVCRQEFVYDGQTKFDEKVGIFPFTEVVPAQKKSKNNPKGTLETKTIHDVTNKVMMDCLIHKICYFSQLIRSFTRFVKTI